MSTVIDRTKPSTYYIFEIRFRVLYNYQASRSAGHLKLYGTPTVGNEDIDRSVLKQRTDAYLTINDMLELYKKGVSVEIVDRANCKDIYECISYHLSAWRAYLSTGLNNNAAPLDDLKLMDEFANSVYEHAKWQFTDEIIESVTLASMVKAVGFNKNDIFSGVKREVDNATGRSKLVQVVTNPDGSQPEPERRKSLKEYFRSRQLNGVHNLQGD